MDVIRSAGVGVRAQKVELRRTPFWLILVASERNRVVLAGSEP